MSVDKLTRQIEEANRAYSAGRPYLTDHEYDKLWTQLYKLDPDNELLWRTHRPDGNNLVKHPQIRLSLRKAMEPAQLLAFTTRYQNQTLVVNPKFDGVAVMVYIIKDQVRCVLAGDGHEGLDVTRHFVNRLDYSSRREVFYAISCEAVILNKDWDDSFGSHPRNVVAGWLNRDEPQVDKPITLVRHAEDERQLIVTDDLQAHLLQLYNQWSGIYPVDGLVIKVADETVRLADGHNGKYPFWAIAWKPPIEVKPTTVHKIEWEVSKDGRVVPTIVVAPVRLKGATIQRATGNNAEWVLSRGIGVGAEIEIGRAGEIIPQIVSVIRETEVQLPTTCPLCDSELSLTDANLWCTGENCIGTIAKRLEHMYGINGLNLKGLGPVGIANLLGTNYGLERLIRSPWLVLLPDREFIDYMEVCLGEITTHKILDNIDAVFSKKNAAHLLASLGAKQLGYRQSVRILQYFFGSGKELHVTGPALDSFDEVFPVFKEFMQAIKMHEYELQKLPEGNAEHFCITGTLPVPREEAINELEGKGWIYTPTVSRYTTHLIVGDTTHKTNKMQAAESKGVKVITYDEALAG